MNEAFALLAERCKRAPAMLQTMLVPEPSGAGLGESLRADLRFAQTVDPRLRFVITGIGTSEGPARLLAHLLGEHAGAGRGSYRCRR